MTSRAQTLVDLLTKYDDAYYNGTPLVPDSVYDPLRDELVRLDPSNAYFSKVGAPVNGAWPKVRHAIPMTSLNKAQNNGELVTWGKSVGKGPRIAMDKLDGLSVALKYFRRKLVQALTRGDGITGEDITRNVLLMQGAIKMLPATIPSGHGAVPTPDTVYIRGEIVCKKSDFKLHFPGESNPRNTASGTAKRQSNHQAAAHLTIITYQFLPDGVVLPGKSHELHALNGMGFNVPRWTTCLDENEIETHYQEYVAKTRLSLDYEIDGLVIDVADTATREALGDLNNRPKGSIAYKFPHESKQTTIRAIRWQVGNSGRITPVAEFDEVLLMGARVTQASLHTADRVKKLRLFKDCSILVSRRNDVIPMVEANISEGRLVGRVQGVQTETQRFPQPRTPLARVRIAGD